MQHFTCVQFLMSPKVSNKDILKLGLGPQRTNPDFTKKLTGFVTLRIRLPIKVHRDEHYCELSRKYEKIYDVLRNDYKILYL
jgi:hypothetical protein